MTKFSIIGEGYHLKCVFSKRDDVPEDGTEHKTEQKNIIYDEKKSMLVIIVYL